jgi:signal transduction histidine kinase
MDEMEGRSYMEAVIVKFLIADDMPANLKLLRVGLEADGHQVVDSANGLQALAVLERESVDAVITDVLMPSMDGFQLCRQIRKSSCDHRDVPIVLYTATYTSESDRVLAESVGADAYILKPAPVSVLIDAVQEALRLGGGRSSCRPPAVNETNILEQYNAVLVHKLETRNGEIQVALTNLQLAHEHIVNLNEILESRVAQRTRSLEVANKELEAFSFTISHDLRAPLRRISGFAQLLSETAAAKLGEGDREFLKHIVDGVAQMGHLIDALLEFARTTRAEMRFAELDLERVLDDVLVLLHSALKGRNIEWRRGAMPKVRADETLLRQVFVNLLSNAVKYTRNRELAVIEIGSRHGREDEIVLFVRDNGVGFDMRYAAKLFGVFQRMHPSDQFEGIGIGLANAQRIVTRHGGRMWAEAAVDRGATFYLSLPK